MAISCYAQNNPPAPQKEAQRGPPCAPANSGNGGNRPTIPPPVGLCLPIDDYVYILMGIGVMYGCYKMRDFKVS